MNQRALEPLTEAPASVTGHLIGTCGDCRRPVIKRAAVRADSSLRRWAAPGTLSHPCGGPICQSCWLLRGRKTGAVRTQPSSVRASRGARSDRAPLTDREIRSLRLMVGACVECGWAPDEGAKPHECETE